MEKISRLEVGGLYTLNLAVLSATARETKAKKSYLALEFFDGVDKINANYWDWAGVAIPAKNSVLTVTAQVTEWQGVKQLNVRQMVTCLTEPIENFAPLPPGHIDINEVYKNAYELVSTVKDDFLRELSLRVLEELQSRWLTIPGAKGIHHAYLAGTLIHCYSVAKLARTIAENTLGANVDLCIIGGMLHDLGKLYTYKVDGITIGMTDEGMLYDHLMIGAEFIGNFAEGSTERLTSSNIDKLELLRHIILSHHGKLEYGAVVPPLCIEAHIVYHADSIDAAAEQIRDQSAKVESDLEVAKWTDRIWALENRPHLSTQYVQLVISNE